MTDHSALIERLEARIGQDFDGECHLTEAEAREIISALRDLTEWREIATAPRDVLILAWSKSWHWQVPEVGYFHSNYNGHKDVVTRGGRCGPAFRIGTEDGPTHWLPLQSIPNQEKEN